MTDQNEQKTGTEVNKSRQKTTAMRFLTRLLTWENCFFGLAALMGLGVNPQSGILVLILWQLIKMNDRKTT